MTDSPAVGADHPRGTDRLQLALWHIDRYDRLRQSTSSRAAVLMSANAAVLGGVLLLANSFFTRPTGVTQTEIWAMRTFSATTIALSASSIYFCANAIATWRTTRQLHHKEIPLRFAFNWGDTIRSVDGFSDFATKFASLEADEIQRNATGELWTAILQHKRRHKYLRYGIHTFRAASLPLLVAAAIMIFG